MTLIVQKYGGTSVGSIDKIRAVAKRVGDARDAGHEVIVVLSAMAGETDRLQDLGSSISARPAPEEMDVLLAAGEQASIALLAMALKDLGHPSRSYLAHQVGIRTDADHQRARIEQIDTAALRESLAAGVTPVVAGFQGIEGSSGRLTTLGRGGSDTTAVAVAAAVEAHECQICTDVDGVYTADPRIVADARRLDHVTFEEMFELASLGSKVLHPRSVEFAGKYAVPLRVLSSFAAGGGTLITVESESMEQPIVSGIAHARDEAKITMSGVPDVPGVASKILGPVGRAPIDVDMIVQNTGADGLTDFTFTVKRGDYARTLELVQPVCAELGARSVSGDDQIAKVSVVGVGMRSHAGVAMRVFDTLAAENINIQMISTSEIKISVVVAERYMELAVRALHAAFELDEPKD
ncbi:MAG: aspartate kinase [Gammaproteobacteria bacterium]|nr:aspartate kinase [Gammaproteobacteria bacterium]MXX29266.1 aspartate kinase [Gammaproteobacteria bacterium]MYE52335.1 aspartate kinase [Gammaproteobacteria bacterium]MYH15673.1 aspartate kinase [Gammaproteobacteria bacterium]MYK82127.1 aspartate kinase [Gammaproteobacteria bacterium]